MSEQRFNPGDIVRLRSSEWQITVRWTVDHQAATFSGHEMGVHVDWFDLNGILHQAVFLPEQLELVSK